MMIIIFFMMEPYNSDYLRSQTGALQTYPRRLMVKSFLIVLYAHACNTSRVFINLFVAFACMSAELFSLWRYSAETAFPASNVMRDLLIIS